MSERQYALWDGVSKMVSRGKPVRYSLVPSWLLIPDQMKDIRVVSEITTTYVKIVLK